MFKIMFGVAGGILLAGFIGFIAQAWFAISLMEAGTEIMNNSIKQMQQTATPPQTSILNLGTYKPAITPIQNLPFKTKTDYVKENSNHAVIQARQETQDFDKQYKKPEECYNTTETKMRIKCANEYMRARKAFEIAQGQ